MSPSQSAITQRGWGAPQPAGRYRPGGSAFSSAGFWSCRDMEGFLSRGWELILPGCGGTSSLGRGATLVAHRLHEPQPISNQPVGLGFSHRGGQYRPGGPLRDTLTKTGRCVKAASYVPNALCFGSRYGHDTSKRCVEQKTNSRYSSKYKKSMCKIQEAILLQ